MADVPVSNVEVLKQFAQKVTTSSQNERIKILDMVAKCASKELPENAVKGILKYLLNTLGRYHDRKSQQAVLRVVSHLSQSQPAVTLKCIGSALSNFSKSQKNYNHASKNLSSESVMALIWTCIVAKEAFSCDKSCPNEDLKILVAVQSLLIYGCQTAQHKTLSAVSYKHICSVWKKCPESISEYLDYLSNEEAAQFQISLMAFIMKYFAETKNKDSIMKYKKAFINIYLKQVLACRTSPPIHILEDCKFILRHVNHEEFKGQISPAAQKAMLRNPEIILEAVEHLLSGVQLDLSQYALELGKPLAKQLFAKELSVRGSAAAALKALAKQCSDPGAVEKLTAHLFTVLAGSEGKLTSADQRIGVMQGIYGMSFHVVSGSTQVQNLSSSVCELFIPILSQEVHEGTLVSTLQVLKAWCSRFYTEVPEKLVQWFVKGMNLKSSTSVVRNAYIQCMSVAFQGDTLQQARNVVPVLVQVLEKASNQSSQVHLVTEVLSASKILTCLSLIDIDASSKFPLFWNLITDLDKQLLFNEKFLLSLNEESTLNLVFVIEKIILNFPSKFPGKGLRALYKAFIFSLTNKSWPVRKRCISTLKQIGSLNDRNKITVDLIDVLGNLISTQKLPQPGEDDSADDISTKRVNPKALSNALLYLTNLLSPTNSEIEAMAMASLIPAHHPVIVLQRPNLWKVIMKQLKHSPKDFVERKAEKCLKNIYNEAFSQSVENALATLVSVAPEKILPKLVGHLCNQLTLPEFFNVSQQDFGIFQCSEGELYDKSVMENILKDEVKETNIRRENKLYSYAEQMAEIELRKEIEKKKRGKGDVKLTKKQEEKVQAQLKKESEVRSQVKKLDAKLSKSCDLINAAIDGGGQTICYYMVDLCRVLVPLLKSPLAARRAYPLLVSLSKISFSDKQLGQLVGHGTVRVLEPLCPLAKEWTEEKQLPQTIRIVHRLYDQLQTKTENNKPHTFPASTVAFFFHLLSAVLSNSHKLVKNDEAVQIESLKLIIAHAKIRSSPDNRVDDVISQLYDPQLLPHCQLFELLLNVIGRVPVGKLQSLANEALLEVANCLSGAPGCAILSNAEISVLLLGTESSSTFVREAVFKALLLLTDVIPSKDDEPVIGLKVARKVWVGKDDKDEEIQLLAQQLEEKLGLTSPPVELCTDLIEDVIHHEENVRKAASSALAKVLVCHRNQVESVLYELLNKYEEKLFLPPPEMDTFGRVIGEQPPDEWTSRSGIALCLTKIAPLLPQELIAPIFAFYVPKALGDRAPEVQSNMRDAALAAVNEHGKENVNVLLPVFEDFLSNAADSASNDVVRQSIVILMGSLAKHLDKDSPKVKPIVQQLIAALSTPSQEVQIAVSYCLPPLVPAIKSDASTIVQQLLKLLLESDNYGERKGAAYGLAGLIKGLGIVALKQMDIMTTLTNSIQDKKSPRKREGALFAFEMLCTMLGKLFEPYVVVILPHLLLCFGDNNMYVRQAADDTAKAVMTNLSGHGVKFVLPSLLKGLEEDAWRTKTGSVELLGAMAFCAPKQLSACLPNIVPKLIEVLTDSHNKVQRAGAQALQQIGSVIRNPEIQAIVPVLLAALQDPTQKTYECLQALLDTKFVHFIDAASLALIMPVVERAFQDRTTDTRKMAAQIIGNMYSLTDQKDLSPYLPTVIPGLKQSLLDPVPEVRCVSARALGTMVRGMGEGSFDDLLPWLMETLVSERSSVDRSGAAQGLSEVIGGMGLEKLQKFMPDIVQTADRNDIAPHVRDGYIMMYIYLPLVFKENFVPYIGQIIPSILKALADESEFVRETALRAGQRIINMYAETAIELLLPELENGLFDENWRIRYSSVQLLGDLLYRVSGVSGKMSTETANEDDNFGTESSQKAVLRVFGEGRRNRVLAGLYMGRSDTALLVRQSALHVWKIIVTNTPRTLREILPVLFSLLLGCLASTSYDKRQVAARTLGDLVRKLGERVLPEIIPILEKGLDSKRSDERQGVCIGLSEIMASTSRDHVTVFADSLIPSVRRALCDPLPEVREAAARTFDNLHHNIGSRALDEILPDLLKKLANPATSEWALDGLKQVMTVKSRVVLPYLVPQLITTPVNTRALAFLSSVAGDVLSKHLNKILPALLSSLSNAIGTPKEEEELGYCESVVLSVTDDLGTNTILNELLSSANSSSSVTCCAAVNILKAFCSKTKADYSSYYPQLLRALIALFARTDHKVLLAAWKCLDAITKDLKNVDANDTIQQVRLAIRFATSDFKGKDLPGFSLNGKGVAPLLPIFREGILNGTPEMKELAAEGLGEIISLTSAPALMPSVIHITGPLIRILGDRFPGNVKVAVLATLTLLLSKVGASMKPFLPQLQTTFTKALNDSNRTVRLKAAAAMGGLILIHTRVDPLITELHTNIKNTDDTSIRDTTLQALRSCITGGKEKFSDNLRKMLMASLLKMLNSAEDSTRMTASGCLGALTVSLPKDILTDLMITHLLDTDTGVEWTLRHGRSVALAVSIKEGVYQKLVPGLQESVLQVIAHLTTTDRIPICLSGLRAATYLLCQQVMNGEDPSPELVALLVKGMKHDSNEVKQLCGQLATYFSHAISDPLPNSVLKSLVPSLVMGTKEKNTVVKGNSEYGLLALLHLQDGEDTYEATLNILDVGMQEALQDVYSKTLKKLLTQAMPVPEEIDDSLLL